MAALAGVYSECGGMMHAGTALRILWALVVAIASFALLAAARAQL